MYVCTRVSNRRLSCSTDAKAWCLFAFALASVHVGVCLHWHLFALASVCVRLFALASVYIALAFVYRTPGNLLSFRTTNPFDQLYHDCTFSTDVFHCNACLLWVHNTLSIFVRCTCFLILPCLRRLRLLLPKANATKGCLQISILNFHPIDISILSSLLIISYHFFTDMSTTNKDQYYSCMGKSLRGSPGESQGGVFFRWDRVGEQSSSIRVQFLQHILMQMHTLAHLQVDMISIFHYVRCHKDFGLMAY